MRLSIQNNEVKDMTNNTKSRVRGLISDLKALRLAGPLDYAAKGRIRAMIAEVKASRIGAAA